MRLFHTFLKGFDGIMIGAGCFGEAYFSRSFYRYVLKYS